MKKLVSLAFTLAFICTMSFQPVHAQSTRISNTLSSVKNTVVANEAKTVQQPSAAISAFYVGVIQVDNYTDVNEADVLTVEYGPQPYFVDDIGMGSFPIQSYQSGSFGTILYGNQAVYVRVRINTAGIYSVKVIDSFGVDQYVNFGVSTPLPYFATIPFYGVQISPFGLSSPVHVSIERI